MHDYELTVVVTPGLTSAEQQKLVDKIEKFILQTKGQITQTLDWCQKELAYPIARQNAAHFHHLLFAAEASAVSKITQKIKLESTIIRYLLVKTEGKNHGAKVSQ